MAQRKAEEASKAAAAALEAEREELRAQTEEAVAREKALVMAREKELVQARAEKEALQSKILEKRSSVVRASVAKKVCMCLLCLSCLSCCSIWVTHIVVTFHFEPSSTIKKKYITSTLTLTLSLTLTLTLPAL
jgi:hypothetical protein